MSTPDTHLRKVPPVVAGFVAIICFGTGSALGALAGRAADVPAWLSVVLYVAGAALGYLLGRTVLRFLYTPRTHSPGA